MIQKYTWQWMWRLNGPATPAIHVVTNIYKWYNAMELWKLELSCQQKLIWNHSLQCEHWVISVPESSGIQHEQNTAMVFVDLTQFSLHLLRSKNRLIPKWYHGDFTVCDCLTKNVPRGLLLLAKIWPPGHFYPWSKFFVTAPKKCLSATTGCQTFLYMWWPRIILSIVCFSGMSTTINLFLHNHVSVTLPTHYTSY